MNADQMKEFVKLCKHPAIAGKQGRSTCNEDSEEWERDWFEGDHFWYQGEIRTIISNNGVSLSFSPPHIRRYMAIPDCVHLTTKRSQVVWLPPVFDYQHPERGLWGMVDKTSRVDILWQSNNTVKVEIFNLWNQFCYSITGPLPIALAKAIIWQAERRPR